MKFAISFAVVMSGMFCTNAGRSLADELVVTAPPSDAAPDRTSKTTAVSHNPAHVLTAAVDQAHSECFRSTPFPSAEACGQCHPQHYREWSTSPHAYAQMSPVFNAMSNTLIKLTNGTLGDF
ncbi:MAG: hypothetical protein GY826_19735, partial [Fuerstiella sp.]|nr:hypothetical protein [Fuerstiella sp.]